MGREAEHEAVKRAAGCVGIDEQGGKLTDIHHQRHGGVTCVCVTDV